MHLKYLSEHANEGSFEFMNKFLNRFLTAVSFIRRAICCIWMKFHYT